MLNMKVYAAVILALSAATPAFSLSYLDQISKAPAAKSATVDPPFFFTNGATDEPATPTTPAFVKTAPGSYLDNISAPAAPAWVSSFAPVVGNVATTSANYLTNLASRGASGAPTGAGITQYLDALPRASAATSGAGIRSYAEALNEAGAAAVSRAPAAPAATAWVSSFAPVVGKVATTSANYLTNLASRSSSGAPTGAGITQYLDALPRVPTATSGAGIRSYAEALNKAGANAASRAPAAAAWVSSFAPVGKIAGGGITGTSASYLNAIASRSSSGAPTGAGIIQYLDALPRTPSVVGGGGIRSYAAALSGQPGALSGDSSQSTFTIGSVNGKFNFSFEADAALLQQLAKAGNRKVQLTGKVNTVDFN
jgi:hypothetical protein